MPRGFENISQSYKPPASPTQLVIRVVFLNAEAAIIKHLCPVTVLFSSFFYQEILLSRLFNANICKGYKALPKKLFHATQIYNTKKGPLRNFVSLT